MNEEMERVAHVGPPFHPSIFLVAVLFLALWKFRVSPKGAIGQFIDGHFSAGSARDQARQPGILGRTQ